MELNQYFEHKYKNVFSFEEEKFKENLPRTPLLIGYTVLQSYSDMI